MKAVEVSLNNGKGELHSAYCLKCLELSHCIDCFSVQIALGLRFQIIAKNLKCQNHNDYFRTDLYKVFLYALYLDCFEQSNFHFNF